jgi:hypothetical protein
MMLLELLADMLLVFEYGRSPKQQQVVARYSALLVMIRRSARQQL